VTSSTLPTGEGGGGGGHGGGDRERGCKIWDIATCITSLVECWDSFLFFSCVAQDESGKCVSRDMQGPRKYIGVGAMMSNGDETDTPLAAVGMSKVVAHPVLHPSFNTILCHKRAHSRITYARSEEGFLVKRFGGVPAINAGR
jgi:hypothetical protein